jgi:hypothetical protein
MPADLDIGSPGAAARSSYRQRLTSGHRSGNARQPITKRLQMADQLSAAAAWRRVSRCARADSTAGQRQTSLKRRVYVSGRWRTRDRRWPGRIIPEPEEQTAFAAILFDMDAEIVALVSHDR